MTDDEQGLQRAEQLEAALRRELTSRLEVHRAWLETQLASLNSDADQVQRELEAEAARRTKKHHELKDLNPELTRGTTSDGDDYQYNQSRDAWLGVLGFFGLTALMLVGTGGRLDSGEDLLPFVALADLCLAFFGFLAMTPLWSLAPKPPALMPERPALPHLEEALELGSGTWRNRLENAQARLMRLTSGDQAPERSAYVQQVLAQARADLQRFIADGRAYLGNVERDHLGWQGVAWPEWMSTLRKLGLVVVPGALVGLVALFDGMGLLHGAIALGGGLAAGFFRGSNLSFVEPPEAD